MPQQGIQEEATMQEQSTRASRENARNWRKSYVRSMRGVWSIKPSIRHISSYVQRCQEANTEEIHEETSLFLTWIANANHRTRHITRPMDTEEAFWEYTPVERHLDRCEPERRIHVLDAVADFLAKVNNVGGIAIAVRIVKDKCQLMIAGDRDQISPPTFNLIHHIWEALQDLDSDEQSDQEETPAAWTGTRKLQQKIRLMRLLITWDFERFDSHLTQIIECLKRNWSPLNAESPSRWIEWLIDIVRHLEEIKKAINGGAVLELNDFRMWMFVWNEFCLIRTLYAQLIDQIDDISEFNIFRQQLSESSDDPSFANLYRTLRNAMSIMRCVDALYSFCRSTSADDYLNKDLQVIKVGDSDNIEHSDSLHCRGTTEEWKSLVNGTLSSCNQQCAIRSCFDHVEHPERIWYNEYFSSRSLFNPRKFRLDRNENVHCEMKLFSHLLQTRNRYPSRLPACRYIGTSAPPCRCCDKFRDLVSLHLNMNFKMQLFDIKKSWPCRLPEMDFSSRAKSEIFKNFYISVVWDFWNECVLVEDDPRGPVPNDEFFDADDEEDGDDDDDDDADV